MEDSAACASQAERGLLGSASRERDKSAKDFRHEITLGPERPTIKAQSGAAANAKKNLPVDVTLQCERQSVWFNSAITYPAQNT